MERGILKETKEVTGLSPNGIGINAEEAYSNSLISREEMEKAIKKLEVVTNTKQ